MQIIKKVRSSITQLNHLLLEQLSNIAQSDTVKTPITEQTTTDRKFNADIVNSISSTEHSKYHEY